MNFLASKLTKRIILQSQQQDSSNWQDVLEVFAAVNAISEMKFVGIEIFRSMQLISTNPYLFIIRYLHNISNSMRILYNKRIFNIKRIINPNEQNIMLKIICEEDIL